MEEERGSRVTVGMGVASGESTVMRLTAMRREHPGGEKYKRQGISTLLQETNTSERDTSNFARPNQSPMFPYCCVYFTKVFYLSFSTNI